MTSSISWPALGASLKKFLVQYATASEKDTDSKSTTAEGVRTSELNGELPVNFDDQVNTKEQQQKAFRQYCNRFGTAAYVAGVDQITANPVVDAEPLDTPVRNTRFKTPISRRHVRRTIANDSDGEEVVLCCQCQLPIGENWYCDENTGGNDVHAECVTSLMHSAFQEEHDSHKLEAAKLKRAARLKYDIGWHAQEVPRSSLAAQNLGCYPAPQGMCCLVFNQETHSVHVAATLQPAQAINLEYLSLCLRVRLRDGREPFFSLDPVDASDGIRNDAMQLKRFEPEWLAGTSVGEVMFQADYLLKELSMGEYSQPVIGMKSCFDFSEEDGPDNAWSGREWFIVRKADIALTEDKILVPRVRMGIEAREQVLKGNQMIDVRTTRKGHPMVRYADSFSHYFDLIAERRSVVFHLRELAKASVMARMLIDGCVNLYGPWFDLSSEAKEVCSMEVPQLWNHREHRKIQLNKDNAENAHEDSEVFYDCHGLYGGVSFGLTGAALSMPSLIFSSHQSTNMFSAGNAMLSGISSGHMAPLAALKAVGLSAATAPSVSAAAARPAAWRSSVKAGLARPATGLASVTAGLAPRPAVCLHTSKRMIVKRTRPRGPRKNPSEGPSALTTTRPAAGVSAETSGLAAPSQTAAGLSAVTSRLTLAGAARPTAGLSGMATNLASRRAAGLLSLGAHMGVTTLGTNRISALGLDATPRGVDLNLDQFNLSSPIAIDGGASDADNSLKYAAIGKVFWSALDGNGAGFSTGDLKLLRAIYNPCLSDRREESEYFIPPDTSYSYVQRLCKFVQEEESCRWQRLEHFFNHNFSAANPGNLFPSSWKPTVEIAHERFPQNGELHACHYKNQAVELQRMLLSATPAFDRSTEEGIRFRIYRFGSLEVRTTQQPELRSVEVIGAVFSTKRAAPKIKGVESVGDHDISKLVTVTEYVEHSVNAHHSYLVMESEKGSMFVTEKLTNGKLTWEENPEGLEARIALSKKIRSQKVHKTITVDSMRLQALNSRRFSRPASSSNCKHYVQAAYSRAIGAPPGVKYTGFKKTYSKLL